MTNPMPKPIGKPEVQLDLLSLMQPAPITPAVGTLPPHVLKPTNTIIKQTPTHVDYIEAGHKHPHRYFITGPLAGTGLEMTPDILAANASVLEG